MEDVMTEKTERQREIDQGLRDPITGRLVGKKAAGSQLDGQQHKEFPK